MNIENTQSQMRKGVLEFCILSIIKRGEAYPSDIIEEMKRASLNILEGTLYPLLTRLKNADLLSYRWVESSGGPPRKYFSLTDKGNGFYKELENTWREMSEAVGRVIQNSQGLGTGDEGQGTADDSVILSEAKELQGLGTGDEGQGTAGDSVILSEAKELQSQATEDLPDVTSPEPNDVNPVELKEVKP
jgi:PadR family transcriptional regulator PadR